MSRRGLGRGIGCLAVFFLLVIIVIPSVLVRGCDFRSPEYGRTPVGTVTIKVYDIQSKKVIELDLERYVEGVVAGEMPALFHCEALKSQAIAARTYAIRKMRRFGGPGDAQNLEADISSDPARDQAWLSDTALRERWGMFNYYRYRSKIAAAVQATAGLILTYQGEPITPVYHSTCGGQTENSEDVFTYEVPYLRSVTCSSDQHSPHYRETIRMPLNVFIEKTGLAVKAAKAEVSQSLEVKRRSPTGRLTEVRVGEKTLRGQEFRMLLGLPSAYISWTVTDSQVEFASRGYGHGVGMCQYGADGTAKQWKEVNAILEHYFTGAKISRMFAE